MKERSDSEVPLSLLNLVELPLMIEVHHQHLVVENHWVLDPVLDPVLVKSLQDVLSVLHQFVGVPLVFI